MGDQKGFATTQEAFWAGQFGKDYIDRNRGDRLLASNLTFFSHALRRANPIRSCLELGANIGMNLKALKLLYPEIDARAVEINALACEQLSGLIGADKVSNASIYDWVPGVPADQSFTKGVLIHLDPSMLPVAYDKLYSASSRFVLIGEYYNPAPVEIDYRGHSGRLFKRDFAGEMLDRFADLALIDYGFAYRRDPSFAQDDITWFLMEKGGTPARHEA